ncbi:MAG TPA: OsmC family protein [Vicinamibacterales bacterium]|nr:OsmC family protein [Vicinamibacterales bacterium]
MSARIEWDGEQQFTGFVGKHEVPLDGSQDAAASPMQLLALSLAGCMAIDVVLILARGRHDCTSLSVSFVGDRTDDHPKYFNRVRLHFTLAGAMRPEHVERAIALSHEKYCSVWASLRKDIDFDATFEILPQPAA